MRSLQLIIGNKAFSHSSLRPWLLLKMFNITFDETSVKLFQSDTAEKLGLVSPSLKVPVLIHNDIKSWDSLSICEYINDSFLDGQGWPRDSQKKAAARSVIAECHSDFSNFNKHWPMNCQNSNPTLINEAIEKDIARLDAIMYCCRRKYGDGGKYLFGRFSIADCFMAPYCIALRSYQDELSWKTQLYLKHLLSNPWIMSWINESMHEDQDLTLKKNIC